MRAHRSVWKVGGAAACALLLAAGSARADLIDTTTSWNGFGGIGPFAGAGNHVSTAGFSYGQTFLVGKTDTQLDNVTFWVKQGNNSPLTLNAYIAQWDGTKAVNAIQIGTTEATTNNGGAGGMQAMTFANPGGLLLKPGEYVAYITAQNKVDNAGAVGFVWDRDVYKNGQMVYQNPSVPWPPQQGNHPWLTLPGGRDLAFRARLSDPPPQPVPPGLVLAGIGSFSLLGFAWRGRKRSAR
jgi:hypothetical protein